MTLPPDFCVKLGPWALVTGASAGIGAEFARQLAEAGLKIVLVARRRNVLEDCAKQIQETYGVETRTIVADVGSEAECRQVAAACEDLEIGLLVSNAGMELHGSFFKHETNEYMKLIDINCRATILLSHAFGRKMAERKRGGIIMISSMAALGLPFFAVHSASKSFVSMFARVVREELAMYNVRVIAIEPGIVDTRMAEHASRDVDFGKGGFPTQPVEDCVRESLSAFVSGKVRHITCVKTRVMMNLARSLPEEAEMKVKGMVMESMMDPSSRTIS